MHDSQVIHNPWECRRPLPAHPQHGDVFQPCTHTSHAYRIDCQHHTVSESADAQITCRSSTQRRLPAPPATLLLTMLSSLGDAASSSSGRARDCCSMVLVWLTDTPPDPKACNPATAEASAGSSTTCHKPSSFSHLCMSQEIHWGGKLHWGREICSGAGELQWGREIALGQGSQQYSSSAFKQFMCVSESTKLRWCSAP